MTKNVFEMVHAMVNGQPVADMETLRAAVNEEYDKMNKKREANRNAYDTAKEVAFNYLCDVPMTVKELFAAGEGHWPEGFTAAKVQYAMLHYWNDLVVKHDNGKGPYTYTVKA